MAGCITINEMENSFHVVWEIEMFQVCEGIRKRVSGFNFSPGFSYSQACKIFHLSSIFNGCHLQYTIKEEGISLEFFVTPIEGLAAELHDLPIMAYKNGKPKLMDYGQHKWVAEWPINFHCKMEECPHSCNPAQLNFVLDINAGKYADQIEKLRHFSQHGRLWENTGSGDFQFQCCDGVKIKFHSCVLVSQAADSPVIAAMLQSDFKEKNLKMAHTQYTSETMDELLKFLYVRQISTENNSKKIQILYVAANYYGISDLMGKCINILSDLLTCDTITGCVNFYFENGLHLPSFYKSILTFIVKNFKAVLSRDDWLEFLTKHPKEANQLVIGTFDSMSLKNQ